MPEVSDEQLRWRPILRAGALFGSRKSLPKEIQAMKANPKTEAAVMSVVKQMFEAFTKRDINRVMAFFAPEPDVVVIGTGKDEKCVGPNQIRAILKRAFAQFKEASVKFGWHSVSAAGSVALVAADVVLSMKTSDREIAEHLRLTVALEQQGNKWLIMQWHDSVPAAGQEEGQAFAT
jgi:uncharacterized protein (TIGR02246 family)